MKNENIIIKKGSTRYYIFLRSRKLLNKATRKSKRKLIINFFIFFIFTLFIYNLSSVSAQTSDVGQGIMNGIAEFMSTFMSVINALLFFSLGMIGSLLENDYIFGLGNNQELGTNFQGADGLRLIWVYVRDFVNIAFVFVLVGAAIYTVVTAGKSDGGNTKMKTMLPKFIISLVLVNFSYLICKVVLDTSSVLTTAVFSIVHDDNIAEYFGKYTEESCPENLEHQQLCEIGCKKIKSISIANRDNQSDNKNIITLKCHEEDIKAENYNGSSATMLMAMGMQRVIDLPKLASTTHKASTLTISIIFSFILFLIYSCAYIALMVALIIRMIVLWVVIPLSPMVFLGMVAGDTVSSLKEADKIKDTFLTHAFMPVKVAAVLSFSFIMMMINYAIGPNTENFIKDGTGSTTLEFDTFIGGNGDFRNLLWGITCAMVVYKGTMEAFKGTMAEGMANSVMGFVGKMGEGATTVAKHFQFIPMLVPDGNGGTKITSASANSILGMPTAAMNKIRTADTAKALEIHSALGLTHDTSKNKYRNPTTVEESYKNIPRAVKEANNEHDFMTNYAPILIENIGKYNSGFADKLKDARNATELRTAIIREAPPEFKATAEFKEIRDSRADMSNLYNNGSSPSSNENKTTTTIIKKGNVNRKETINGNIHLIEETGGKYSIAKESGDNYEKVDNAKLDEILGYLKNGSKEKEAMTKIRAGQKVDAEDLKKAYEIKEKAEKHIGSIGNALAGGNVSDVQVAVSKLKSLNIPKNKLKEIKEKLRKSTTTGDAQNKNNELNKLDD